MTLSSIRIGTISGNQLGESAGDLRITDKRLYLPCDFGEFGSEKPIGSALLEKESELGDRIRVLRGDEFFADVDEKEFVFVCPIETSTDGCHDAACLVKVGP